VSIVVDRLQSPAGTKVQSDLADLLAAADGLSAAIATAREDIARATSLAKDAEEQVARLDTEIAKATDGTNTDATGAVNLSTDRETAVTEAADHQAATALAQAHADAGTALAQAVATFVANVQTTPASGVAPIVAAAHGEILRRDGTLLIYAKVVAAGVDIELKSNVLLGTKWYALSAVSAEYAIFDARGTELTAGVRSVLQSSRATLRKGLADIKRERLLPPIVEAAPTTKSAFTR
jgi:hypothetical protein